MDCYGNLKLVHVIFTSRVNQMAGVLVAILELLTDIRWWIINLRFTGLLWESQMMMLTWMLLFNWNRHNHDHMVHNGGVRHRAVFLICCCSWCSGWHHGTLTSLACSSYFQPWLSLQVFLYSFSHDPHQQYLIDNIEMVQWWAARWVKQDYRLISCVSDMNDLQWSTLYERRKCSRLFFMNFHIKTHQISTSQDILTSLFVSFYTFISPSVINTTYNIIQLLSEKFFPPYH